MIGVDGVTARIDDQRRANRKGLLATLNALLLRIMIKAVQAIPQLIGLTVGQIRQFTHLLIAIALIKQQLFDDFARLAFLVAVKQPLGQIAVQLNTHSASEK